MANNKKKKIVNDVTTIDSSFLQPIFGGDFAASPSSPEFNGHLHDGNSDTWGHAPKIDLTGHTTGRVTLQDSYAVARSISSYPSILASPLNVFGGTFLNIASTNIKTAGTSASLNGGFPFTLDGYFNAISSSPYSLLNASNPVYPFTVANIISTAIWYFAVPLDMDVTKSSYFSFEWMGDIIVADNNGNVSLDTTKVDVNGAVQAQTTNFRVTWQWYSPGFAIFPPAVIYDGYAPTSVVPSSYLNQNSLTRGRIAALTVNEYPFKLVVNDSSLNNPNYVGLTGLQQATNAVMVGVQVDVLSSGFTNPDVFDSTNAAKYGLLNQTGHVRFYQGNLIYLSKIMGSPNTSFRTF
jgi:hypothetical protein